MIEENVYKKAFPIQLYNGLTLDLILLMPMVMNESWEM